MTRGRCWAGGRGTDRRATPQQPSSAPATTSRSSLRFTPPVHLADRQPAAVASLPTGPPKTSTRQPDATTATPTTSTTSARERSFSPHDLGNPTSIPAPPSPAPRPPTGRHERHGDRAARHEPEGDPGPRLGPPPPAVHGARGRRRHHLVGPADDDQAATPAPATTSPGRRGWLS